MTTSLSNRPLIIAIAGSNGAGKSTFYESHLSDLQLPFINADQIALTDAIGVYEAAEKAQQIRHLFLQRRISFIFETVFSDPVGDKVVFLERARACGFDVVV